MADKSTVYFLSRIMPIASSKTLQFAERYRGVPEVGLVLHFLLHQLPHTQFESEARWRYARWTNVLDSRIGSLATAHTMVSVLLLETERTPWWMWPLKALSFFFALFFLLPTIFYRPFTTGRDPNWEITLHHAFEHGWVFGKDIVFTYGPLGVLHSRLAYPGVRNLLYAWDMLALSLLSLALIVCIYKLRLVVELFALVLLAACLGSYQQPLDASMLSLFFSFYFVLLFARHQKIHFGVTAWSLASIAFFIKVSTGVLAMASIVGVNFFLLGVLKARKPAILTLMCGALIFTATCLALPVDVFSYAAYSIEFIKGYAEAMYKTDPANRHYLSMAAACLLFFGLCSLAAGIELLRAPSQLLAAGFSACFLFILFKQGFVRADSHIFYFFQYAPLAVVLGYSFFAPQVRRYYAPFAVLLLVSCFSIQEDHFSYEFIAQRVKEIKNYHVVADTSAPAGSIPSEVKPSKPLSAELLAHLDDHSVDIMTFQSYQLLRSKLDYQARPVFQSYAAYTRKLDRLNAKFFLSENAPHFLLYSYTRLDDRYSFFDESITKRTLRSRYRLSDHSAVAQRDSYLVLERKNAEDSSKLTIPTLQSFNDGTLEVGKSLQLTAAHQKSAIEEFYLQLDIRYTFLGKVLKFFYKAPPCYIELGLANGQTIRARAIPEQLRGGVLISHAVYSLNHAAAYFAHQSDSLPRINSIKITASWPWGVEKNFNYALLTPVE